MLIVIRLKYFCPFSIDIAFNHDSLYIYWRALFRTKDILGINKLLISSDIYSIHFAITIYLYTGRDEE